MEQRRPEDIARCQQRGIAAYLLKPVKQSELFDAIVLALGVTAGEQGPGTASTGAGPGHLTPLHILLAEDSLVNQKLAVALLERHGHMVAVAGNGREAIAALESRPFDLVLMDVQMPEMDGLEATAMIRAREKQTGAPVPIVAMTAHALKGDRERCLAAGMDDYVSKPIRTEELYKAIARLLPERHSPPATKAAVREESVDWKKASAMTGADPETLKTIIAAELDESPRLMATIREAAAAEDWVQLRLAAHTLKGSAQYFGAERLFEYATRLEELAREGKAEEIETLQHLLERELDAVTVALNRHLQEMTSGQLG